MRHLPLFLFAAVLLFAVPLAAQPPAAMPPPVERGSDRTEADDELARAREALAEAARRVAELSAHEADRFMRHFEVSRVEMPAVRLGVRVGEATADGVVVASVSEGGPAAQAGIEAGDLLLAVNGVSVAGAVEPGAPSVRRVQQALAGLSPGDEVKVDLRRGRRTRELTVTVDAAEPVRAFAYRFGDSEGRFQMPDLSSLEALRIRHPFGNYELVRVSPDLGRYFNTEAGLLVVRVGDDNPLTLRDGDVILSIDGRTPESPTHAARILRSYAPGETAKVEIMRDRRKQTLEVTIPERRRTATMQRDAAPGLPLRTAD